MLNFKLKANAVDMEHSFSPLVDYLQSLGIDDPHEFIGMAHRKNEISGRYLDNAMRMIAMLGDCFEIKR